MSIRGFAHGRSVDWRQSAAIITRRGSAADGTEAPIRKPVSG
jgi:hypothetical protein